MNMIEAAAQLNGCEYREEGTRDIFAAMKDARLVAVFGASDDLLEFRGAVYDEMDAIEDATAYFIGDGLMLNACEDDGCPYFAKMLKRAAEVKAEWRPDGFDGLWLITTALPHAQFDVMDDGELYCRGLVFSLADCPV